MGELITSEVQGVEFWWRGLREEFFIVWRRKKGLLASPGEKDSSAQGPVRGRRVCSFIGVGFPWPLRSPAYESSEKGILVGSRMSSFEERGPRGKVSGMCFSLVETSALLLMSAQLYRKESTPGKKV